MRRLINWFNILIKKRKELKRWQRIVTVLAAMITFATTYALILPAITVEKDNTGEVAGMYLEKAADQDVLQEENAFEPVGVSIDADETNAATVEDGAVETDAEIPEYDDYEEEDETGNPAEDDGEEIETALPVKVLKAFGSDYTVILSYDETSGIPDEAILDVSEIPQNSEEYQTYLKEAKKAMGLKEEETLPSFAARFFDIKIMVDDQEFTPETGVSVEITYTEPLAEHPDTEVSAVHFADESAEAEVIEANTAEIQDDGQATVEFTAESFSVYGVIYTVDFHWEVNGKTYDFRIPGGGFVSLEHLVEVLGLGESGTNSNANDNNVFEIAEDPDNEATPNTSEVQKTSVTYDEAVNLNEMKVSTQTKRFVAEVESVKFTSPELIWTGKISEATTVGELKKANGLEVKYSADLTDEKIAEINAQTVEAGDWVFIGMRPFTSEETLTVTMKNGEQFVVKVTDAQISTHVITADGKDYLITVTYGPEAGIPDGAKLEATEILEGTDEYNDCLTQTEKTINSEEGIVNQVNFARFFDITIRDAEGNKIEPENAVSVSIKYNSCVNIHNQSVSVVHFAKNGIELLDVEAKAGNTTADDQADLFVYSQSSFSISGTIVTGNTVETGRYFIVTEKNGRYYALKNNGSSVEVTKSGDQYVFANDDDARASLWDLNNAFGSITIKDQNGNNIVLNPPTLTSSYYGAELVLWSNNGTFQLMKDVGWGQYTTISFDNGQFKAVDYVEQKEWRYWEDYWHNKHYYQVTVGSNAAPLKFAKYSIGSGTPPPTEEYEGHDVDPSELSDFDWDLDYDDMMIDDKGCSKTAEVFDYENRIYEVDITAKSSARILSRDIDLGFSLDLSNSMLFPSTLTEIGVVELKKSSLEQMVRDHQLDTGKVYFVISDVNNTATVTAIYYDSDRKWKHLDASKYARGQSGNEIDDSLTIIKPNTSDNGYYVLYEAPQGYVDYIKGNGRVYNNPYNRLTVLKESIDDTFSILDKLSKKYNVNVRVGWNGFAGFVKDPVTAGEHYNFSASKHPLKNLEYYSYADLIRDFEKVGNTDSDDTTGGGTRPDRAFSDAKDGMGWSTSNAVDKYLILVTDGAPQGGKRQGESDPERGFVGEAAYQAGLLNNAGVNIISLGLSTERVEKADELFRRISCTIDGEQMKYQAKDTDALKKALKNAILQLFRKATVVGNVTDTIDNAFYPVSNNGLPLEVEDWITLEGVKITNKSQNINTPHGVIGKDDNGNYTVTWSNQDITWPNDTHPEGWHGKVLVKVKEDFLGGNTISTNAEEAVITPVKIKDPISGQAYNFDHYFSSSDDTLDLTPAELETPFVDVDELYIPPQETQWDVYIGTEVDPYSQIKELYKNINVLEVVRQDTADPEHRLVKISNSDMGMLYDLKNGNTESDINEAIRDGRPSRANAVRNVIPLSDYLIKRTVSVEEDEIVRDGNGQILYSEADTKTYDHVDLQPAEWEKLLAGGTVYREYSEYGHTPGLIEISLTQVVKAGEEGLPDVHRTEVVGTEVEKYVLNVKYIPYEMRDEEYHTGTYRTQDSGLTTENITSNHKHIINVIKRILTVKKTKMNNLSLDGATFKIYQKDGSGNEINTVTLTGGTATWDYVLPDEDQKIPGDYWKDSTTWYLKEAGAPEGYAGYDGEIEIKLNIADTKTTLTPANSNNAQLYTWNHAATLAASGYDTDYVTVTGNSDISIAIRNEEAIDIIVIKTDTDGQEIPGAKFTLKNGHETMTNVHIVKKGGSWANAGDRIEINEGVFTIPEGGVTIIGLKSGEYTLEETASPEGYIKTLKPVRFKIVGKNVTYQNPADNPNPKVVSNASNTEYTIQNEPGVALPATGGPGTSLIYFLGIILTCLAGVGLMMRKRCKTW